MRSKHLSIENGKFVLRDKERKYPTTVIKNIIYNNIYLDDGEEIPVGREQGDFQYGVCGFCNHEFILEDQKYCEECGYEL